MKVGDTLYTYSETYYDGRPKLWRHTVVQLGPRQAKVRSDDKHYQVISNVPVNRLLVRYSATPLEAMERYEKDCRKRLAQLREEEALLDRLITNTVAKIAAAREGKKE